MFIFLLGCTRKELSPAQSALLGTWRLTEFCMSPGDASCPPQAATATIAQTLEFRQDGSFLERAPQPDQFRTPIDGPGTYRIDAPNRIAFTFSQPSSYQQEVVWAYSLSERLLTIRPGCREGCAYTYRKIK